MFPINPLKMSSRGCGMRIWLAIFLFLIMSLGGCMTVDKATILVTNEGGSQTVNLMTKTVTTSTAATIPSAF